MLMLPPLNKFIIVFSFITCLGFLIYALINLLGIPEEAYLPIYVIIGFPVSCYCWNKIGRF